MITKFNSYSLLLERYYSNDLNVDWDIVDDYFEGNWEPDEETYKYMGQTLFWYMDEDYYMDQVINDFTNAYQIDDCLDDDYMKSFIVKNEFIDEVNDLIKENEYDIDLELPFDEKVDELEESDLKDIIVDNNQEYEYVEFVCKKRYKDMSVQEFLDEMGYREEDYYEQIQNYIDYDALDKYIIDNEDSDFKKDFYLSDIEYDEEKQIEVFDYDKYNSEQLFDIMSDKSSFGKSFEFQNTYIDIYFENYLSIEKFDINEILKSDKYSNSEKEDVKEELMTLLEDIDKKFGLNSNVEKKYTNYVYRIKAKQFNI